MKANQACSWQSVPTDKAAPHVWTDQESAMACSCASFKRSLHVFSFLQGQPVYTMICKNMAYSAACVHVLPYLAFLYLSIIDRTTNCNLLLQGLETGYQAHGDIWQCQAWSKAMIDKLYSQKLVSDQVITVDRGEEEKKRILYHMTMIY